MESIAKGQTLSVLSVCSRAGGQVIGLERAGFEALAHVEFDRHACETLRLNRPDWNVVEGNFSEKCRESSGTRRTGAIRDVPEGDCRVAGSKKREAGSGQAARLQ